MEMKINSKSQIPNSKQRNWRQEAGMEGLFCFWLPASSFVGKYFDIRFSDFVGDDLYG
jgi:hypothetical protein